MKQHVISCTVYSLFIQRLKIFLPSVDQMAVDEMSID
jgi:hypothetical protein